MPWTDWVLLMFMALSFQFCRRCRLFHDRLVAVSFSRRCLLEFITKTPSNCSPVTEFFQKRSFTGRPIRRRFQYSSKTEGGSIQFSSSRHEFESFFGGKPQAPFLPQGLRFPRSLQQPSSFASRKRSDIPCEPDNSDQREIIAIFSIHAKTEIARFPGFFRLFFIQGRFFP